MTQYHLILSHPPQPGGNLSDVAALFGLEPFEVRQKANYPVPEIWFADENEDRIVETAARLSAGGLRVTRIRGSDIPAVGPQHHAESVEFAEAGMVLRTAGGEHVLPYGTEPIGVFCQPKVLSLDGKRTSGSALGARLSHASEMLGTALRSSGPAGEEALGQGAFLDLYVRQNGGLHRFSIDQASVGPDRGDRRPSGGTQSMAAFVALYADRFSAASMDRRLVGMILRKPLGPGEPPHSRRKGFSFATVGLRHVLGAISPALVDISQTDLSSRLAYLTRAGFGSQLSVTRREHSVRRGQ